MEKTVETIVKHPFATALIIASITRGIATIIIAVRGGNVQPAMTITNNLTKELADMNVEV